MSRPFWAFTRCENAISSAAEPSGESPKSQEALQCASPASTFCAAVGGQIRGRVRVGVGIATARGRGLQRGAPPRPGLGFF
eukprot:5601951-Pyramimonas_sp.AAC.1